MFSRDQPDFHVISVSQPPEGMLEDIRTLLQQSQLGMDDDIEQFVVACSGRRLVGCAGLVSNTIKCVAVAADWRGKISAPDCWVKWKIWRCPAANSIYFSIRGHRICSAFAAADFTRWCNGMTLPC